jgi:RNA polymerase sigma factor (sigma-70 family)
MEAPDFSHSFQLELERQDLDALAKRFAHRVRFFTHRIERRYRLDPQWRDDLISCGYWGLLKALRNRRADALDQELSAYVSRRVEGAVIDEARRILSRISNHVECDPLDLDSGVSAYVRDRNWDHSSVEDDPECAADRAGRWRSIEMAMEHLDADHRDLLWSYAEGRSISEIARAEGSSAGRLQGQLARITREIRARSPELRRLLRHEI